MPHHSLLALAALLALASPSFAETELADQATGAAYLLADPADGEITLTNKVDGEMDSYILTQDCYAKHPIYGLGAWQAVEGGWRIMVQGTQIVSFEGATPFENPACVPQ